MKNQLATAVQLTPILARVHNLTAQLAQSPNTESSTQRFDQLRSITKNYAVPADGCEAYSARCLCITQVRRYRTPPKLELRIPQRMNP